MSRPARTILVTVACTLMAAVAVSCTAFPNRENAANKLTAAMRAVPGVSYADGTYTNGIDNGASYQLHVKVDCSVAAPTLAGAARAFVDGVDAAGFPDHVVELRFEMHVGPYVNVPPGETDYDESSADFRLSDDRRRLDVSSADVAADVSFWVSAIQFPGVLAASVSRPPDQQSADGQHRYLWASVVNHDAGIVLQQRFPELADQWQTPPGPRAKPLCAAPRQPGSR